MKRIMPGCRVDLDFSIQLLDGTSIIDTRQEGEPYQITLGRNEWPQGLELALYGLTEGEEQSITLSPDQAWGHHDPQLIQSFDQNEFDPNLKIEVGHLLEVEFNGDIFPASVKSIENGQVTVDFNHPLSGQSIVFWVYIHRIKNENQNG